MTVGFAIDYTAHICHRYEHASVDNSRDRISETLGKVGWPILQAGMSSILGVILFSRLSDENIIGRKGFVICMDREGRRGLSGLQVALGYFCFHERVYSLANT